MKKNIIICLVISVFKLNALVDFWGVPSVIPHNYGPSCLGQEYVEITWFMNWESNNDYFQVQRSQDPNFSWAITGTAYFNGTANGCGTCGSGQYTVLDYGPFQPGEVWYYRIKAVSNNNVWQYKNAAGPYTTGVPTIINWVNQVTSHVVTGSSPSTESSYIWSSQSKEMQGVTINLIPTEINKIYLEENNHKINFDANPISTFVNIDVSVDNQSYFNIYNGTSKTNFIWQNASSYFTGVGYHNLKVKFTTPSATIYQREFDIYVVPKSDGLYVDNYCNTMRVWKGSDPLNGTPLVFSEGFDAYNTKSEQYYREAGKDLINCLLNKGINVYVVNYNLNSQSIANNAAIFQSAIRYVSSINGNKQVVATGMSMGGVINRYACAKAENDGNPLPISKFISIDAPQQGAFISMSLQDYIKNTNASNNDTYSDHASNNDAAKQLLQQHKFDPGSSIHTNFYNSLKSLNSDGYPHLVEKIGVSFSTPNPNPDPQGTRWLTIKIHTPIKPDQHFNLESEEVVAGSYLPKLNKDPFIAGPNKFWWLNATLILHPFLYPRVDFIQLAYPTFIPHNSSLDINAGVSKFDKTIIPSSTAFHDEVPSEIIEPLVNAVIGNKSYIQNKNYSISRTIIASETIYSGKNVTTTQPLGDVNINSGSNITYKAGKEIQLREGLNVNQGANFAAFIEPVKCDGNTEWQYRTSNNNNTSTETDEPTKTYLSTPGIQLVYEDSKISNQEVLTMNYDLNIFPNPTEGIINIRNLKLQNIKYTLFNTQSILIKEGNVLNDQISIQECSSGVYILELKGEDNETKTFRVLKL